MITTRMARAPTGISARGVWTHSLVAAQPQNSSATRIRKARQIHSRISWIMLLGRTWLTGPLLAKPVTLPAVFAIVVRFRQNVATTAPRYVVIRVSELTVTDGKSPNPSFQVTHELAHKSAGSATPSTISRSVTASAPRER